MLKKGLFFIFNCFIICSLFSNTKKVYDVAVIGAGISGLTAGYYLSDDNSLIILEMNNRPGGRAYTGTHRSFHYAKGTEYLGKPADTLKEIIKELRLKPVEIPSPMDCRYYDGKIWYGNYGILRLMIEKSDIKTVNRFASTILSLCDQYDDIPYFDLDSPLAKLDDITAAAWFKKEGFGEIYRDIYNVSSKGLFGANLDEISALSYLAEIGFDFEGYEAIEDMDDVLPNTFKVSQQDRSGSYSFVTGITELTDALAKDLSDSIVYDAKVTGVTYHEKKKLYTLSYTNTNGTKSIVTTRAVVSAVPAPVLLDIAPEILTKRQKEIIGKVPFADFVTAALFSDEPIWNQGFDLAVPDGYFFTDMYDSTWVERHYNKKLAHKKEYIAGVYVPESSYKNKTLLTMSDKEIIRRITMDMEKIFPGAGKKIKGYDVYRHIYAYPVMVPGAYKRLQELHGIINNRFVIAGDFTSYPTFEAAVESGYIAAAKLMDWDY